MENQDFQNKLKKQAIARVVAMVVFLSLLVFAPAGSFSFWQGWIYLGVVFLPFFFAVTYFLNRDPSFLQRRMQMQEKQKAQKTIQKFGFLYYLLTFMIPGFDFRWNWSFVPIWAVLVADSLVILGYYLIIRVFKENSFAARTVQVESGQKLISSGPYSLVRHPMYVGVILMYSATPVALGSWWGLIPALLLIPMLVFRILDEEKLLLKELPGYREYMEKVRFRLIPNIW